MANKKIPNKEALKILNNYFMIGGSSTSTICKADPINKICTIGNSKLKADWCEMTTDMSCIYTPIGIKNIDTDIEFVSKKINYTPQSMKEIKNALEIAELSHLQALSKLLNIETTLDTKELLVGKLLNNRITKIINGENIWSYT